MFLNNSLSRVVLAFFLRCTIFVVSSIFTLWPAQAQTSPLTHPIEIPPGVLTGDWRDDFDFELPPGPRGLVPDLGIVHAKSVRNTGLGKGFMLRGLQTIERRSNTGGQPGYTTRDEFRLNGEVLVRDLDLQPVSTRPLVGNPVKRYRRENDDGSLVEFDEVSNIWRVRRDGWVRTFGRTQDAGANAIQTANVLGNGRSRPGTQPGFGGGTGGSPVPRGNGGPNWATGDAPLDLPGKCDLDFGGGGRPVGARACETVVWRLSAVRDPYGNRILYNYEAFSTPGSLADVYGTGATGEQLPSSIEWLTSQEESIGDVVFKYETRQDPQISFERGARVLNTRRLVQVEVRRQGTLFSQYSLQYKDEAETSCDGGRLLDNLTDWQTGNGYTNLLYKVYRHDADATRDKRQIRCYETHHGPLTGDDWGDQEATGDLRPTGREKAAVFPANLDGDGRADLIVVSPSGDHQVLVSRTSRTAPFSSDPGQLGVGTWTTRLDSSLTRSFLSSGNGWAILDVDRDGYPDLMHEVGNDTHVQLWRYRPKYDSFLGELPSVKGCDLRYSVTADIDGDGYTDLIRRAHPASETCPARQKTRWLRNRGRAPWFVSGDNNENWRTLHVPLQDPETAGIEIVPPDLNPDWTPAFFAADQMRIADVNGDGIADVMYALHTKWTKYREFGPCPDPEPGFSEEPCQWGPESNSVYSRIHFGDGYGSFIDSGLAAGHPILNHTNSFNSSMADRQERWFTSFLSTSDFDRSGSPELLTGTGTGTALFLHEWRGVEFGFGKDRAGTDAALLPNNLSRTEKLEIGDYPQCVSACNDSAQLPVFADFDGDGYPDLLEFRYEPEGIPGTVCLGLRECVTVRYSNARDAEGRVTAMTGSWGGRTELEWAYTGTRPLGWLNPELPMSMEALKSVSGPMGEIRLAYSFGAMSDGRFHGYGVVTRQNANSGVDVYVTGLTPVLRGRPLYLARYREDRSLEKLVVTAYGALTDDDGYSIDLSPPYWNPRLRECHFEVEREAQTYVGDLISECWGWADRNAPSRTTLWGLAGLDRHPALGQSRELSEFAWDEVPDKPDEAVLSTGDSDFDFDRWTPLVPVGQGLPTWRWGPPEASPELPDPESLTPLMVPDATGSGHYLYVTDYEVSPVSRRPTRIVRHRDTSTRTDDTIETIDWSLVRLTGSWRRVADTLSNRAGRFLRQNTYAAFTGFGDPGTITRCGASTSPADCFTQVIERDSKGLVIALEQDRPAQSVSYERDGWCGEEVFTNQLGELRIRRYDKRCLLSEEIWNGITRSSETDGYLRVTSTRHVTETDPVPETTDYFYDDQWRHVIDRDYEEPRSAILKNGRLDLYYLDEFGRATRHERCSSGTALVEGDDLKASCTSNDRRVLEWTLYGTDGLALAEADPFRPDEDVAALTVTAVRDGSGRPFVTYMPGNTDRRQPSWERELSWRAPGRDVTRNALDQVSVTDHGTLLTTRKVAGQTLWQSRRDAFGRIVREENAEAPETRYSYDGLSRLASMRYVPTAEIVLADGSTDPSGRFERTYRYREVDRIVQVIEPDGLVIEQKSDELGRIVQRRTIGPDKSKIGEESWNYERAPDGTLTVVHTNSLGGVSELETDGLGRVLRALDVSGAERRLDYNARNQRVSVTIDDGPVLRTDHFRFNAFGELETYQSAEGDVERLYDGAGRILEESDETGATRHYSYLFSGLLSQVHRKGDGGDWLERSLEYDALYRPAARTQHGVRTQVSYDDLGRPFRSRSGDASVFQGGAWDYDGPSGRVVATRALANGVSAAETTLAYDAWKRRVSRVQPGGGQFSTEYDIKHRPRRVTDADGLVMKMAYDSLGRFSAYEDGRGASWTYSYEDLADYTYRHDGSRVVTGARRATALRADGAAEDVWVDSKGRMIARRDADGAAVEFVYDGNYLTDIFRLGTKGTTVASRVHRQYDTLGKLVGVYGPANPEAFPDPFDAESYDGYAVLLEHGPGGRLERVDAAGEVTELSYDPVTGLLTSEDYLGLSRQFLRPDPSKSVDADLRMTGEVLQGRTGKVRIMNIDYDAAGRLTERRYTELPGKIEIDRFADFDVYGQPGFAERLVGPSIAPRAHVGYRFAYDANGRPVSRRLFVEGQPKGFSRWRWSPGGRLLSERAPFGKPLGYSYGAPVTGRLAKVTTLDDNVTQLEIKDFSADGAPERITYPEGSEDRAWSPGGRLIKRAFTRGGTSLIENRAFDPLGRLLSVSRTLDDKMSERDYAYDATGHLVSESLKTDGATQRLSYQLNTAGARLSTRLDGAIIDEVTYLDDVDGYVVGSVNGTGLERDDWNGVVRDQRGVTFRRSASGAILALAQGNRSIDVLRDPFGLPVVSRTGEGQERIVSWRLGPADLPQAVKHPGGSASTYVSAAGAARLLSARRKDRTLVRDSTGSFDLDRGLLTAGGDAFGATVSLKPRDPQFAFSGMESVPGVTGLHLARHRAYDGQTGQFLSPDPAGLSGGLHRTLYAGSDPIQYADPLGLWACAAQPGTSPNISIPDTSNRFDVPDHDMIGDINTTWEITQLELSMGLDIVEFDFSGTFEISTVNTSPACFKCEPTEGDPGGLPDDDVSSIPTGPIVLYAAGGGDGGKKKGGLFSKLFGGKKKKGKGRQLTERDIKNADDPHELPWAGCNETLSNAGCNHNTLVTSKKATGEKRRLSLSLGSGRTFDDPPESGLPSAPDQLYGNSGSAPSGPGSAWLESDGDQIEKHTERMANRHVIAPVPAPFPTAPDVEPLVPQPVAVPQAARPADAPKFNEPTQSEKLQKLLDNNPHFRRLWEKGDAYWLPELADYPWVLNLIYGENHWSRGDAFLDPILSHEESKLHAEFTYNGATYSATIDVRTGQVTNKVKYSNGISGGAAGMKGGCDTGGACSATLSIGAVSATCSGSAECSAAIKAGIDGLNFGSVGWSPQKDQVSIDIAPSTSAGNFGLGAGIKNTWTYSMETLIDSGRNFYQENFGPELEPPPAPELYVTPISE